MIMRKLSKIKDKDCPLCGGTREVLIITTRLMGATYSTEDKWRGDEHFEPCPLCDYEAMVKNEEVSDNIC